MSHPAQPINDTWSRSHAILDALDDQVEKRRRRWQALHEDQPLFGLVPIEEAELQLLDAEFGEWTR